MEKETPILFNGQPHEYIIPDLYPAVEAYRKSLDTEGNKDLDKEAITKDYYENLALAKAIGEKPSFLSTGIPDNLLFDEEDNLDDALVSDANYIFDTGGVKIKGIDELTEDQKNFLYARRMQTLMSPSYAILKDYLFSKYNPEGRAEAEKWKGTAPVQIQNTSPSRQHSLGMTGQQIDPRYPLFLQIPNPHIPWGVNHPLRVMWRNSLKSGGMEDLEINSQLRHMEGIAAGQFSIDNYAPFWNENADRYPILNSNLRSIHERNVIARSLYPQFYQPNEELPYWKELPAENTFQQKIIDLFK